MLYCMHKNEEKNIWYLAEIWTKVFQILASPLLLHVHVCTIEIHVQILYMLHVSLKYWSSELQYVYYSQSKTNVLYNLYTPVHVYMYIVYMTLRNG